MSKIKVGIIGVGSCAKSLVEGIQYYNENPEDTVGLMYPDIGGYKTGDIEFVCGFDVDIRKVNKPLPEALRAKPNCSMKTFIQSGIVPSPWCTYCGYIIISSIAIDSSFLS